MTARRPALLLVAMLLTGLGGSLMAVPSAQAQPAPAARQVDCDRTRTVCLAEPRGDWKTKQGRKSTPRSILSLDDIDASSTVYRRTDSRFSIAWKVEDLRPLERSEEGPRGDFYESDQYYEVRIRFEPQRYFRAQYITGGDRTYRAGAGYRFSGRCRVQETSDYVAETLLLAMSAGCLPRSARGERMTVEVLSSSSVKHYNAPKNAPFSWYPSVDRAKAQVRLP